MIALLLAAALTFLLTTVASIAGVGAAFVLVPIFLALGIEVHAAMATALLLNAVAASFSTWRLGKKGLVVWRSAIPILLVATALSPLGAWVSQGLDRKLLLWLFVGFLVFAAAMMVFYKPRQRETGSSTSRQLVSGLGVGAFAGFMGGLLGVGGGNFIVPVLVWLGFEPKKASATTSFIIIFSSLSGFFGHASLGAVDFKLLVATGIASISAALLGAYLMTERLKSAHVKTVLGVVLLAVAVKMAGGLL